MTKVLLVEDDPLIADLYTTILEVDKFAVETITEGAETLGHALKNLPDLIVLDLMMPHTSGFEVLEALKAEEKTKDIPVIIFSNLLDSAIEKEVIDKGAARFAIKSDYPPGRFIALVKEVLETSKEEDEGKEPG